MGKILIYTVIQHLFLFFIFYLFIYFFFFLLSLVSLHFIFPVRIDDQPSHYPEEFFKDVFLKMSQNSQGFGCLPLKTTETQSCLVKNHYLTELRTFKDV